MAKRQVFIQSSEGDFFKEEIFEFKFYTGFAISQKQKSISELHSVIKDKYPDMEVLEVSSKSNNSLGKELSAFNLQYEDNGKRFFIENIFQSSKKFSQGGPYKDLLYETPVKAKKDERLKTSGKLEAFICEDRTWPLEPKTFFYDWIYINALYQKKDIHSKLLKYSIFTDIEFNSEKSINCQARSLAIFVSIYKNNTLGYYLKSPDNFLEIYSSRIEPTQLGFL